MRFRYNELAKAKAFFKDNGFAVFEDVLTREDITNFLNAYDECIKEGKIKWKEDVAYESINDAIFLHPIFEKYVKDERLVKIAEALLGTEIELQHSKINDKPRLKQEGETKEAVEWHQDFPFFPHTNFDMLALTIHFDDEDGEPERGIRTIEETEALWGVESSDEAYLVTVAHELAHLRHMPHGPDHDALTREIFDFIWFRKVRKT